MLQLWALLVKTQFLYADLPPAACGERVQGLEEDRLLHFPVSDHAEIDVWKSTITVTSVEGHMSGVSDSRWMGWWYGTEAQRWSKISGQHPNNFLFSHLGIPEDSRLRCRSLLAAFSPIKYCQFYRPTDVVTDPRAALSCSLVRNTVNWTKGMYLIGIAMRRKILFSFVTGWNQNNTFQINGVTSQLYQ